MDHKLQFDVQTASEYDRGVRRTLPTYDALFRLVQAYFRSELDKESNILIVGAGGGTELALLGPENSDWTFTAVDPASAMLDLAKEKVAQLKLEQQVTFIEGTVADVREEIRFDAATFMLVLHFIQDDDDKLKQLTLIRERLKDGAPFIVATMYGDEEDAEFDRLFSLWKAYWLDTTRLSKKEVDDMEKTVRDLSFLPEEDIRNLLQKAGFTNITKFFQTNMFGGWVCTADE